MKKSRSHGINGPTSRQNRQPRRLALESLENRRLLTVADAFLPDAWWNDSFVVRRDEAEPIEITLHRWDAPAELIETPSDWTISADNGTIEVIPNHDSEKKTDPPYELAILYQPNPGFVGIDEIQFTRRENESEESDSHQTDASDLGIAIHVVEPLYGVQDWFQVSINSDPIRLDVLDNDIQNAPYIGQTPELTLVSASFSNGESGGELTISSDGKYLDYQPAEDFEGLSTVAYTGTDADGYPIHGKAFIRVSDSDTERAWAEELETQVIELAADQNRYRFGSPNDIHYYYRSDSDVFVNSNSEASDTSGTNNQVAGIEESDRVKTDGDYLYILSTPNRDHWLGWDFFPRLAAPDAQKDEIKSRNLLTIVDVRQADHPTVVSRQIFDNTVQSLDLNGNRLTVITESEDQTAIVAMDVTTPETPITLSTTVVNGRYVESRRVDQILYVFTEEYRFSIPDPQKNATDTGKHTFFETAHQYFETVSAEQLIHSIFPTEEIYTGQSETSTRSVSSPIDPYEIADEYLSTDSRSHIISLDTMSVDGQVADWTWHQRSEYRLVTPNSIYATRTDYQPLNLSEDEWSEFAFAPDESSINTSIIRYDIEPDGMMHLTSRGRVPGTLNNQFSLDEYDDHLRIATENPWWSSTENPNEPPGTNLYILNPSLDTMSLEGAVEGLAPGEQVYAVRFSGDRGYVVTFRQVDPLFVMDLSVPQSPAVLGQLKIPGYSQYLHVIDENHLIGIGRDADETTGQYESMVVSLFNVTDPAFPHLQDRYEFDGGRSTFSPFAGGSPRDLKDHHAINYFQDQQILAIPIYSEAWGFLDESDPPIFSDSRHSALRTLKIDTQAGISPLDSIEFEDRVDRSIRIGSLLYSISKDQLKVSHLNEKNSHFATLTFQSQGQDDHVDFPSGEEIRVNLTANDLIGDQSLELLSAELIEGEATLNITEDDQLEIIPANTELTPLQIRYLAKNQQGTLIEALATLDPDLVWQNTQATYDVNQDGVITARDALNVINLIGQFGSIDCEEMEAILQTADPLEQRMLFDTSGDRRLSALDALQVINELHRQTDAEGESVHSGEGLPNDAQFNPHDGDLMREEDLRDDQSQSRLPIDQVDDFFQQGSQVLAQHTPIALEVEWLEETENHSRQEKETEWSMLLTEDTQLASST